MTLSGTLVKSTIVAALGGLLFGFDTAVISGTTAGLQSFFALSEEAKGFTVAIAVIGTVFGALFASVPGDKFGRRDSLRGMAILYLISAIGCALAWDWYSLLFFRFIGGLGIGGSSVLGPMYIAEISPAKWRGRLVGFFQFNVVAGILVAYLFELHHPPGEPRRARLALDVGRHRRSRLFFLLMLFLIPRSPRWLVKKSGLVKRARRSWPSAKRISRQNSKTSSNQWTSSMVTVRSLCINPSTACPFSLPSPSPCSTSFPASTQFSTT